MLGPTAFLIFIICCLALAIACVVAMFCASAVIFSRVAFSLAAALVLTQDEVLLVPSGGFLNFLAWSIVILGVVYALSNFPKVDMAFKFFCNILLSVITVYIVVSLCGGIISAIAKTKFHFSLGYEILTKIICVLFSSIYMLFGKKPHYDCPSSPLMYNLERGFASLMYGAAITFLFASMEENWDTTTFFRIFIFAVSTIGAFIADVYLAGKDILGLEKEEVEIMPR